MKAGPSMARTPGTPAQAVADSLGLTRSSRWLLVALCAYLVGHWAWLLASPAAPGATLISNLLNLPASLAALATAWRAGGCAALPARHRLAWRLIGQAYLAISLGDLLWMVIEHGLGPRPFPSWADALHLVSYPLLLAGVLLLAWPDEQQRSPAFWIDAAIVVSGGGMLVWHLVLGPMARQGESSRLADALSLAYPAGTLLLLFALATVALSRSSALARGVAALLVAALSANFLGDVLYGALSLAGAYASGHWSDGLYSLSYSLAALAGHQAAASPPPGAGPSWRGRPAMNLTPYLGAAVGFGLLIAIAIADWGQPLAELAVGAAIVALLGAARIFVTRRENIWLLAERAEQAAEARFSALVQHTADLILILDTAGATRYASPAASRVLGFDPVALPPLQALVAPEGRATLEAQFAAALRDPGAVAVAEARLRHADGGYRTCVITWRNLAHDPNVGGVLAVCHDISARAEAEAALRISEEALRTIIDTAPVGISTVDADGHFQLANPALCAMLGYTPDELRRKTIAEVTDPEDYAREREQGLCMLQGKARSYSVEKRYLRRDGGVVWVNLTGSLIADGAGRVTGGLGIALDITERRAAEEELRRAQAMLQSFIDHAPLLISLRDVVEKRYLLLNQLYAAGLGATAEALRGRRYTEVISPEAARRWHAEDDQIRATGLPFQSEEAVGDGPGQRVLLITKFPVFNASGGIDEIGFVANDITERKRSEAALAESHAFLQTTLDALSAHIAILDADGTVLATNAAWRRFGAANGGGDSVGGNYLQVCALADDETAVAARAVAAGIMAVRDGDLPAFALEYACPSPTEARWFSVQVTRFAWRDTVRLVVAHEHITARKQAEQALHISEARLRTLVQHIPGAAVLLFDQDLRYLVADGQALVTLGLSRETMEGRTLADVVSADTAELLEPLYRAALAGDPPPEFDLPVLGRVFRMRFVPVGGDGGARVGMLLATDITQLRRDEAQRLELQQRLQETQRLESIGTLAGGIAHDFNNLLQAVLGHAELLRDDLPPGSPLLPSVQAISDGAHHAAELTGQLLAYAGKGRLLLKPVALNDLIRELVQLARTTLNRQAQVHHRLDPTLPLVEADASQLRQVILNLLLNASEALGDDGGTIVIETRVDVLAEATVRGLLLGEELPAGRYVSLSVRDSGHGMDEAVQARIFEPFFSTRFTGRGLGLAAVHGIVRGHRGALQVTSAPGKGTTMQLWLPAHAATALTQGKGVIPMDNARGTVLVIDDEATVRTVARRMLERLNFQTCEAASGSAGLAMLSAGIAGLAGVLLDLTMPELGGDVVARAIARDYPGTSVLLMSGYSAEEIGERYEDLPIAGVLQKPFSMDSLRRAMAPLIAATPPAAAEDEPGGPATP